MYAIDVRWKLVHSMAMAVFLDERGFDFSLIENFRRSLTKEASKRWRI
jgi:hypothetical protein